MLENMYHNMTYEELARETRRSDYKLAKGSKRKSQEAIQRFKERCENMPSDYLETFSVLWDIDYE